MKINNYKNVPKVAQCKEYLKSINWKYSHRNIFNNYVFHNKNRSFNNTLMFSLKELREAYKYGF